MTLRPQKGLREIWAKRSSQLQSEGNTVIFVAINGKAAGLLAVADPIKASTPAAICAASPMPSNAFSKTNPVSLQVILKSSKILINP